MTEFSPLAIQIAHLADYYIEAWCAEYGNYMGWVRQVGRPLPGILLTDYEQEVLLEGAYIPREREAIDAFFFWAGVGYPGRGPVIEITWDQNGNPLERNRGWVYDDYVEAVHAYAIQFAYMHPEYWRRV